MENPFDILHARITNLEELLLEIKNRLSSSSDQAKIAVPPNDTNLSIPELAAYLKCSESTIHRYKNNKLFPYYKAGRSVYFKRNEVDKALSATSSSNRNVGKY